MKKILILALVPVALMATNGFAEQHNPFFGEYQNQAVFNFGQGVNSFALIPEPDMPVPFWMLQFAYSQPATFFRLPARQTISFIKTIGHGKKYRYQCVQAERFGVSCGENYEWDWEKYATEMAHLSMDAALYQSGKFYTGLGLVGGVQGRQNARFGTKLMTGLKMFAGYSVTENYRAEFFIQHYSNGDTGGDSNYSYNFYGLGFGYNF